MDGSMDGTGRAATRVFVLSGHPLVRDGLAELLRHEGFEVVGEADTIMAAIPAVAASAPDVALLGNRLVDGTGIEACRALRDAAPSTRCIIVTTYDEPKALRSAALAGADGYVVQRPRTDGLVQTLRRAAAGEQLPTARPASALLHDPVAGALLAHAPGHERAIWDRICQGRTNAQIMTELDLTPQAFSARLAALLARLGYRPAPDGAHGHVRKPPPPGGGAQSPGGPEAD